MRNMMRMVNGDARFNVYFDISEDKEIVNVKIQNGESIVKVSDADMNDIQNALALEVSLLFLEMSTLYKQGTPPILN